MTLSFVMIIVNNNGQKNIVNRVLCWGSRKDKPTIFCVLSTTDGLWPWDVYLNPHLHFVDWEAVCYLEELKYSGCGKFSINNGYYTTQREERSILKDSFGMTALPLIFLNHLYR